ncbi:hypothetical protein THMIRHAM_05400 [Thiomicrorhabdus immobilis]|uniref:Sulfotransferase domain-containing protein n=1 Tax=Thiomicrorhabdus immobilis TaxID=2791037 RepID=A0ABN6CUS5_9GAMM|nr:hypothetical protein [Thiomicrorhabdus immobilis]BCN92755.1 hypothetical protein THMIRHAM_05400 [Thiomicrorhabdus immobilis]
MFNFLKKSKKIKLPQLEQLNKNYDIIVHIGAPKTGSSAIQKYLLENRTILENFGFYYPEHGVDENGISGGQSILGKKLIDNEFDTAKAILETYLKEAKQKQCTLLISAESLFNRAPQLKEMAGDHRCKIISFFRDPIESIYSNYNQGIKRHFATARLETFCQNLIDKPADFYTGETLEKWVSIFGKNHLTVLGYDLEVFKDIPIQNLFLSTLGIDEDTQKKYFKINNTSVNNSYCLAALELKRMLNFILDQNQKRLNNEIDWFLQGISDKSTKPKYKLAERISEQTYLRLTEKFIMSNQKIQNEYLTTINPNFLKTTNTENRKTINQKELFLEISAILEKLERQKPQIYNYICKEISKKITRLNDYEVLKLAEMLNYDINQLPNKEIWFNPNQLKKMPNAQTVDFLRDIAYQCYYRGDLENAQILIEKAREIRPNGPTIVNLSEKIKSELNG